MARPEKVTAVEEISARFKEAEAALLTEYRGLSVTEMAELRNSLREAGADYKVLKNTLARLAVKEVGLEDLVEMLTGPTAIAFVHEDAVEAAKALDTAAGKYPVIVIKGAVLDGKILSAEQTKQLAKLEPREVQLAKIAMLVNQPAQSLVNVFAALLRDLGSMLAQVQAQKESEAPAEEAPAAVAETPVTDDAGQTEGSEPAPEEQTDAPAGETAHEEGEPAEPEASAGQGGAGVADGEEEGAQATDQEGAEATDTQPKTDDDTTDEQTEPADK